MSKEILTHLAFCMEAIKLDTDQCLYQADETYPYLAIILNGCVELATAMDKGTEFPIEHLGGGGILNAHHCLVGRRACVSVRCLKATTFYRL
jgi:hypothetical protein